MESNLNPYQSPEASGAAFDAAPVEVPRKTLNQIKGAWICALITAGVTTLFVITDVLPGGNLLWIDVVLVLFLTLGIYRRSRVCAVLMFSYFIISKLMLLSMMTGAAWFMAALFAYSYFNGIRGTFAYHRIKRQAAQAVSPF